MFFSSFMPYRIESKFIQLSYFLLGQNIEGTDFNERLGLYVDSINVFSNNILVGALSGNGEIGGHSTWFDFLGAFGLISLPIFLFFIRSYKYVTKNLSSRILPFVAICFVYILVLGFVNTIYSPRLLLTLFIFVPFIVKVSKVQNVVVEEKENNKLSGNIEKQQQSTPQKAKTVVKEM
jgi:hypothetical protein